METQTFSLDELFEQHASAEMVKEATAYRTIPTGKYQLNAKKIEGRIGSEKSPWPGARLVHLQLDAAADGAKKGVLFADISHETLRRDDGKLDNPSKLWGQYEKALDMQGKSAGDVVEAIRLYPVDSFVTESFKTPDGYRTPRTDDERAEYVKAGFESRNFVQNVFKAA